MADGTSTVAATGDAGGGTGVGTGTATTDAGSTTATTTAATAAATTAMTDAAASAAATPPWHGDLDEDTIGWLHNKAWFGTDLAKADTRKGFPEMVRSMKGLESIVGRNNIALPKDAADKEGWNNLYAKLGRPADSAGYELKAGEGGDQGIADAFAKIAHEEGLSKAQVHALAPKWNAYAQERNAADKAAAETKFQSTSQGEFNALRQEWGEQSDHKFAAAQRAKEAFGLETEMMDKIERAVGTKAFLTLLSNVGAAVSEDAGPGGGMNHGGSVITKEGANARLKELQKDTAWLDRYQKGGVDEKDEFRKLTNVIANAGWR